MPNRKDIKVRVYLNANEEVIQEISSNGILVEYLDDAPRYELDFHYLFGKLLFISKRDLETNEIHNISLLKIALQRLFFITELNANRKFFTTTDRKAETVRNLLENFTIV